MTRLQQVNMQKILKNVKNKKMSLSLIANWKLNGSLEFNDKWSEDFLKIFKFKFKSIGIAPALYIDHMRKVIGDCGIQIGAKYL